MKEDRAGGSISPPGKINGTKRNNEEKLPICETKKLKNNESERITGSKINESENITGSNSNESDSHTENNMDVDITDINLKKINETKKIYLTNQYDLNDKGPFTIYIEQIDRNTTINDMRVGRYLKNRNINGIVNLTKIGKNRIKLMTNNRSTANSLVKDDTLKDNNLKAFIPSSHIQKIGIIRNIEMDLSKEELMASIVTKNNIKIVDTFRFNRYDRTEKKAYPTATVKVTFRGQNLPEEIEIYGVKRKVQQFVFKVTQCFNCYMYGHTSKNCKRSMRCGSCGEDLKEKNTEKCKKQKKCVNCKQEHESYHKDCQERRRQQCINKAIATENLSYSEADKKYPRIKNRYEILNHEQEFPEIEHNRRKNQQQQATNNVYSQYTNYKTTVTSPKTMTPVRNFNQLFEESTNEISSPINNNPHKSSEMEKLIKMFRLILQKLEPSSPTSSQNGDNNELKIMTVCDIIRNTLEEVGETGRASLGNSSYGANSAEYSECL